MKTPEQQIDKALKKLEENKSPVTITEVLKIQEALKPLGFTVDAYKKKSCDSIVICLQRNSKSL